MMADKNDGAPGQEPTDATTDTTNDGGESTGDKTGDGTGTEGTPPAGAEKQNVDDLPQWARDSLTKANNEAANYRTQLRDEQAKFKDAKTLEEVQELVTEWTDKTTKLELDAARERAGRKYGLPDSLVKRLVGKDEAELMADAESLAPLTGKTPPPPTPPKQEPSGGRTPKADADDESPDDAYKKARKQQQYR